MDARAKRIAGIAILLFITMGASYRTPNFVVTTQDPQLSRQFAEAAEKYRSQLSAEWLGESIPNWSSPCKMTVHVGQHLGAGGATTFLFDNGEVYGWRMTIQGSRQRIVDSVLPHEVTHMILASHFREPLPRWADEGAATSVECPSERQKQYKSLYQFLTTGRGIAFNQMFAMTEYPSDVMPLYAQGFSLTDYLIRQGGRRKYIKYLETALGNRDWAGALRKHYGIRNVGTLQNSWLAWIRDGRPAIGPAAADGPILASYDQQPQKLSGSRQAPATAEVPAVASSIPVTVPESMMAPAATPIPTSIPESGWRSGVEHVAAVDHTNPYAPAPIIDRSRPRSKASDRWLDPRSLASSENRGFTTMPSGKMVPLQREPASDDVTGQLQSARQQPIQEAGQIILEWHRR